MLDQGITSTLAEFAMKWLLGGTQFWGQIETRLIPNGRCEGQWVDFQVGLYGATQYHQKQFALGSILSFIHPCLKSAKSPDCFCQAIHQSNIHPCISKKHKPRKTPANTSICIVGG